MTQPPITDADIAAALAGDRVGPEDAACFLGVPPSQMARWRRPGCAEGPAFTKVGSLIVRYAVSDLIHWRRAASQKV